MTLLGHESLLKNCYSDNSSLQGRCPVQHHINVQYKRLFDELGLSNEGEIGRPNADKQLNSVFGLSALWFTPAEPTSTCCMETQLWDRMTGHRTCFTGMRRWMQMKQELEYFHSQQISHGGTQHSPLNNEETRVWYSSLCGRSRSHGCDKWTVSLSQTGLSGFLIRLN